MLFNLGTFNVFVLMRVINNFYSDGMNYLPKFNIRRDMYKTSPMTKINIHLCINFKIPFLNNYLNTFLLLQEGKNFGPKKFFSLLLTWGFTQENCRSDFMLQ